MILRFRLARAWCLAGALLAHPMAANLALAAVEGGVNSGGGSATAVDAASDPADSAASDSATGSAPSTNFGIAAASCHAGMTLAGENPSQLGGLGLLVCMIGICFEAEDFMSDHAP